jgi:hypothetical protein
MAIRQLTPGHDDYSPSKLAANSKFDSKTPGMTDILISGWRTTIPGHASKLGRHGIMRSLPGIDSRQDSMQSLYPFESIP